MLAEADQMRLPILGAGFETLRNSDQIYVDKTALIYDLVTCDQPVFFSRPRRFGKSLLVSTVASLFERGLKYFKGLHIEHLWHEEPCKVLRLDFSAFSADAELFKSNFLKYFKEQCESADLEYNLQSADVPAALSSVLGKVPSKSVVLLIDGYERPLMNNLADEGALRKVSQQLRDFYLNLKGNQDRLRFLMVTGTIRFNAWPALSEANVFKDVSCDSHYGALLGFTDAELSEYFTPYIRKLAALTGDTEEAVREKLKAYYGGYCFDFALSLKVCHPWLVLNAFKDAAPGGPYRFCPVANESHRHLLLHYLTYATNSEDLLDSPDAIMKAAESDEISLDELTHTRDFRTLEDKDILCQLGYLTFKHRLDRLSLSLGYPNREIRDQVAGLCAEYVFSTYRKVPEPPLYSK